MMYHNNPLRITVCVIFIMMLTGTGFAALLNISGVIRDSLSHDPLPLVTVTITEFGKSFATTRSGFFVALEPSTYRFRLEADAYEPLNREITVTVEGEAFTFDMVKLSDRADPDKHSDSLFLFQKGFYHAIANQNITDAYAYMIVCKRLNLISEQFDSMMIVYQGAKGAWVDSIFAHALALEDSNRLSDAFYYYKKIVSIDSLHEGAKEHLAKTDALLVARIAGKTHGFGALNDGSSARMTAEQIQTMFHQAVNKFIEEDYEGALVLLKTILKHDPNHEGAENYLSRTQARLQIK